MIIVLVIVGYLMLLIASVQVVAPHFSPNELERRLKAAHGRYTIDELRYLYNSYIDQVRVSLVLIVFAVIALLTHIAFGLWVALVVVVLLAVFVRQLARYLFAAQLTGLIYRKYERHILQFIHRSENIMMILFGKTKLLAAYRLGSREELEDLITNSPSVLTDDERHLLLAGIKFSASIAQDVMRPSDEVISVAAAEIVGPLVLDDLFKSGQQIFPVVEGSLDHTIGVLEIKELLTLRDKKSQTARALMVSGVSKVAAEQSLREALGVLLHEGNQLAVVNDVNNTTIGIITLNDIIGQLVSEPSR